MKNKKKNGSYYTPEILAKFIVNYITPYFNRVNELNILEPSVGDGVFIKEIAKVDFPKSIKKIFIKSIEKKKSELLKAEKVIRSQNKIHKNISHEFIKTDFLKYQKATSDKFSLILGNPPYIKKNVLNKSQISLSQDIHNSASLGTATFNNIWTSFVIRCTQLLTNIGVLAFVLPAELLQVKFSNNIRSFLIREFDRIEIFTFEKLLFNGIGQDTILLICYKKSSAKGQFYTRIKDLSQLAERTFTLKQNKALITNGIKWSHHILSSNEIEFLQKIKNNIKQINYYCNTKPGIVTAANNYFIINSDTESQYDLSNFTKPIIQKSLFVNGSVVFNTKDWGELEKNGKPSKIIVFTNSDNQLFSEKNLEYLKLGKELEIHKRYKCTMRKNWYVIPNVTSPAQGFFFKRSHIYPKILRNDSQVLVTDSAYMIEMKNACTIESLIYSFYNSLTLSFAELDGRYYGEKVLELTPNEFKGLPIPYTEVTKDNFTKYCDFFENKSSIEQVLNKFDEEILIRELKLSSDDVNKIQSIRKKLIKKRFRNS